MSRPAPARLALVLLLLAAAASPAAAGEVEILAVAAGPEPGGTWRFDVTLRHGDTGWEHYADAWEVLAPDGTVLGRRDLLHPHVDEQPFTRSLGGVAVPAGIGRVQVRAHDRLHGWTSQGREVRLTRD